MLHCIFHFLMNQHWFSHTLGIYYKKTILLSTRSWLTHKIFNLIFTLLMRYFVYFTLLLPLKSFHNFTFLGFIVRNWKYTCPFTFVQPSSIRIKCFSNLNGCFFYFLFDDGEWREHKEDEWTESFYHFFLYFSPDTDRN